MTLEVIAKGLIDVIKINQSQADRIEFCRNLEVGGLTPYKWKIVVASKISKKPINVMLRYSSESFTYSDKEFAKLIKTAKWLAKRNINGVIFGILKNDEIDIKRTKQIIRVVKNKQKVFHKAFDEVNNFKNALEQLEKIGIDNVLTSAGKNINDNLTIMKSLKDYTDITIIAGGGVTFDNINKIKKVADEIHVGTAVRKNNNWKSKIDINKINRLKTIIENN